MDAIFVAVEKFPGGQSGLAGLLNISPQAVGQWVKGARPVPAHHCAAIEAATGVRCENLRPDLAWQRDRKTGAVVGYFVPTKVA